MPEISRFFEIVIYMYFNEHNPPHFHVKYHDSRAQIAIATLALIEGNLPPKQLKLVMEWAEIHQQELLQNWHSLQETGRFAKIDPLN